MLLLVIGGGYWFFKFYYPAHGISGVLQSVKGIQTTIQNQGSKQLETVDKKTSSTSALPNNNNALQNIQQEVSHLKISDVSSSSPQIQKIIKQLQALPNNQVKAACMKLCGNL